MINTSSSTYNIRHTAGRKTETPDGDDTIGLPVTPPKNSDTVISAHLKSMISEEKKVKEFPVISPRPSITAQKTKTTTKAKTVKIRIPWWNELISKEESELNAEDKNAREDLSRECVSKISKQGRERQGCNVTHRQGISNEATPTMRGSDDKDCESEDEYYDPISNLRELTEIIDIKKGHENPNFGPTGTNITDDESNKDEEYQEQLIDLEATNDIINKHDAENDEIYHDTLETIENPKDLVINRETALDSGIDEDEE